MSVQGFKYLSTYRNWVIKRRSIYIITMVTDVTSRILDINYGPRYSRAERTTEASIIPT